MISARAGDVSSGQVWARDADYPNPFPAVHAYIGEVHKSIHQLLLGPYS